LGEIATQVSFCTEKFEVSTEFSWNLTKMKENRKEPSVSTDFFTSKPVKHIHFNSFHAKKLLYKGNARVTTET
jgi:hypothetical protein